MAVVIKVGETEAVSVDIGEKVYIQGDPGFSPTIEVSDITGGHRLTITDINGDKTVDVMNGLNGDTGNGIDYITLNTDYTMTVHYTNGTEWISGSIRGEPGEVTQVEFDALADAVSRQESDIEGKQDAPADAGTAGQVLGLDSSLNPVWVNQSGGGGATNYNDLSNKPQIEGVTLSGNKTAAELGLAKASDIPAVPVQSVNGKTGAVDLSASDVGALPSSTEIPSKTSDLTNDSGFVNAAGAAAAAPVQSVNGSTGAVTVQPTITANGILKGNGTTVSAATKGTDYGAKSFTVTLTVAGWSNNAQTVSNSNFVTSGYAYIVSPASGSFADYGSAQIYADDVTTSGRMTFHCTDVPSAALTVNIVRVVSA